MTVFEIANAALLVSGAAMLSFAAQRARALLRLRRSVSHAGVWGVLAGFMLFFVVGYLAALVALVSERADLLAAVTGPVFFGGALFVLLVTLASHRTLSALVHTSLSQRQIGQILDALGDAVMLVDDDGVVRMANRKLAELVDLPMHEILGRPSVDVVGIELPSVTLHDSAEMPRVLERELHGRAGAPLPVSLAVAGTEARIGTVVAFKEMREQQVQRQRLENAVQVAEDILRVRQEFMSLVALELHDPLHALEVLRRRAETAMSPADVAVVGDKVSTACGALERAIEGLIEVARLGGSVEGTRSFSPAQMLSDVASDLDVVAARQGADVSIEVEPGVPAVYFGRDAQIREVLRLLGMHALGRTAHGEVRLTVGLVPGDRAMSQLLFSVRDTGPSLSGSRVDLSLSLVGSQAAVARGSLDLVICRLLALSLGGRLTVTNTADDTVTAFFTVEGAQAPTSPLPSLSASLVRSGARSPRPRLDELAAPRAPAVPESADLKGNVLVVEDNAATRELLLQQLRLAGHVVHAVGTVREALEHVDREPLDAVLLDVLLPDGSGVDLLAELRRRGALERLSVLMISTLEETASIAACLAGGAEDYLPKRVSPIVLRARLAACIEKQRLRARARQQLALLTAESQRANKLLRVLLPEAVADELQATGSIVPRRHEQVAVMFADIVGFTAYCDRHFPEEVLASLQDLFTRFESLALECGVQKIKTIGDSFMGAAGLFTEEVRPALPCVELGLKMLAVLADHPTGWQLRVGVHVGPVVGGVAGTRQFLYDIWGDTVNTAQRIEHAGPVGVVCVSEAARAQVAPHFAVRALGAVEVKGKGSVELFAVEGAGG